LEDLKIFVTDQPSNDGQMRVEITTTNSQPKYLEVICQAFPKNIGQTGLGSNFKDIFIESKIFRFYLDHFVSEMGLAETSYHQKR
jgi:hypothetical protein